VRCAVEVQREMASRNAEVPEDTRIQFRMGINLGDIIKDGRDIYGDGVNVAARLEALAEPGGICVNRVVRDQVRDKLDFGFEDAGEQRVKNIARPLRVYHVRPGQLADEEMSAAQPPLALPDKPSLAVLPFTNMSGDPEQEFVSDGIAEDVISALSHYPSLFVIARNSTFTYKGRAVDVKQVGRELGVRYVLEGGVRKAGNRIRVTAAQLIEAETGNHVWANRYDRDLADIFAVQDEITHALTTALTRRLPTLEAAGESRRLGRLSARALAFEQGQLRGRHDCAELLSAGHRFGPDLRPRL
jgi:adenylate cyclase